MFPAARAHCFDLLPIRPRKQLLLFVMLSMSIVTAPVWSAGLPRALECGRLDVTTLNGSGVAPSFEWTILPRVSIAPATYKIAVFGDSLTSERNFIEAALLVSGVPKTAVLPSFIQAGMKVKGLGLPVKTACATTGWQVGYAHKEKRGALAFSKGLLSMASDSHDDVIFMDFRFPLPSTRVKQLDIVYEKAKPDDSVLLGVSIDGGDERLISLSRTAGTVLRLTPEKPVSTLRLRLVSGQVTIHGFEPVYQDAAAVQVDTLSVPGALLRGWANVSERFFPSEPGPGYDLILVQYGTNEGAGTDFNREKYVSYLRTNLSRLRSFYPASPCILIGPPDRGVVGSAGPPDSLKYAHIHHQISLAQRQVSAEYRCGFWDWQSAMGGPGSATQWARANPPLMQADLTHLTARGYEISGRLFAQFFPLKKYQPGKQYAE